jgi:hypothetical protein
VAFEYHDTEPQLDIQAEDIRLWNEWVSVLADDQGRR